ncbi:KDP operon transcriptional regulatory protein KdpE [Candidatus Phycosocius bacilliformis]|uniref:KDP operon transcriptional regulatory protein KdpE n=1 Tax=Candidatus Phycosocius bacilliformis TaxID=1445552 RepID=A0A2P2ECU4_9PROT|nr:response regulator transcription factor [Candidatus Phycosocius bacilliformis]GBF58879.1 KDP operon transcriptional regulatory protein KdpE [Candidatus Phycosocius bacilliformis]
MQQSERILIVDDEIEITRTLEPALRAIGCRVRHRESGLEALKLIANEPMDCILLDLGLPDIDGIDVVRRIREWSVVPILVVTAREGIEAKIEALDAGADDYVNKPYDLRELLARLRVALRHNARRAAGGGGVATFDDLVIDFTQRSVTLRGQLVQLTHREYQLLKLMATHAGQIVTHKHILEGVWGGSQKSDAQAVRVLMGHLRQKIEQDPVRPKLLLTETGLGYRMQAAK